MKSESMMNMLGMHKVQLPVFLAENDPTAVIYEGNIGDLRRVVCFYSYGVREELDGRVGTVTGCIVDAYVQYLKELGRR